jgi:hypothetical protein
MQHSEDTCYIIDSKLCRSIIHVTFGSTKPNNKMIIERYQTVRKVPKSVERGKIDTHKYMTAYFTGLVLQ